LPVDCGVAAYLVGESEGEGFALPLVPGSALSLFSACLLLAVLWLERSPSNDGKAQNTGFAYTYFLGT